MRVLLIEDQADDVLLIQRQLVKEGLDPVITTAANARETAEALESKTPYELVLCDFVLPGFGAEEALNLVRDSDPDVPFIILSGVVRIEDAVEIMRAGATDFVTKDDLGRLGPSIRRALHDSEERIRRRDAENQLLQMQKLEAIGRMTAGIAHDFNNQLTVILGNLEIVSDRLESDSPVHKFVEKALSATEGGVTLAERLLDFSRKREMSAEVIDLHQFVDEFEDMFGASMGRGVEFETFVDEDAWSCFADRGQLQTALLNLIINSRDAMEDYGKIRLVASNVSVGPNFRDGKAIFDPGDYVSVAVEDTGPGIPSDVIDKIFEPFFTTKGPGKGTGLGMSMVYGFARQAGGHVAVSSEKGVGTSVRIYLPRAGEVSRERRVSA